MTERRRIGLLDTSVVIDIRGIDVGVLPLRSRISTITLAELGVGLYTTEDIAVRARRTERLQRAEVIFDPLPFTTAEARRFIHVVGLAVAAGRSPKARRQDLMIAATASVHGLPLFTRNADDFRGLESVVTVMAV